MFSMKPLTREWVDKAEGDFVTARRELRARKAPNYDAACFHAQQCAEKYLKARLQEEGIAFSRTHDLATLLDLLLPVEPSWAVMRSDLDRLTSYAVEFRYPGTSADKAMARSAVAVCQDVRHRVRVSLGLAP
jgi:HEPN domain-containing protein